MGRSCSFSSTSSSEPSSHHDETDMMVDEDPSMMPAPMWIDTPDHPYMTRREKKEAMAKAEKLIRTQFAAGVPLFTKAQLRHLAEQIDACNRADHPAQQIDVEGIDGNTITFTFNKGKDFAAHPRGPEFRFVAVQPVPHYSSLERLLFCTTKEVWFNPVLAYLPVSIAIATEIRNTETGEVLDLGPKKTSDYAAVREKFDRERRRLEDGECFAQLRACLTSRSVKIPAALNKVVAFALGCISWDKERDGRKDGEEDEKDAWDPAGRSMAQHSLMLVVRDLLRGAAGAGTARSGVKCYAQDPAYAEVDKRLLSEEGATVLEDPRGFLEVDENCVVISAGPNVPVRQIVADIARPAVLIWDEVDSVEDENDRSTDPVSTRVAKVVQDYIRLPWASEETALCLLTIYVRKDLVQDEAPLESSRL